MRLLIIAILAWGCWAQASASGEASTSAKAFFRPPSVDRIGDLPAEGVWPRGQRLLWAGYSGVAERDLREGFSVAGPHYGGGNEAQLAACERLGLPVIAHVGPLPGTIPGGWDAVAKLPLEEVRARTAERTRALASNRGIVMWAVQPEELRPWRKDEMAYLKVVTEAIRSADPEGRPIFLYNPNHRDADSLAAIVPHVDVVAKGCYANSAGHKDNRAWIRWSVEQMEAAAAKGRPGAWTLVMPELCKDPDPADRPLIRTWVRHDCYLGLMSGAKGMLTWSLFPRKEVKATWKTWHEAYAECGREVNGERGLGRVFLFGERRDDLRVTTRERREPYPLGVSARTALEAGTSLPTEGTKGVLHPWTKTELQLGARRWVFLANSVPEPTRFELRGIPGGAVLADAFTGKPLERPADGAPLVADLAPWEIRAWVLSK
jgi:hypothetical protein